MALLPTTIEVSAKDIPEVRAALAVFLDLLGQVDTFIEQQGEANFYTGPARAIRDLLAGKQPAEHLQRGLDKFLAERGIAGVSEPAAAESAAKRAFEIADEAMFELVCAEAVAFDSPATEANAFGLVDENCGEVTSLDATSTAIREAFEWLKLRGYVELATDGVGAYIRVIRRPGAAGVNASADAQPKGGA